MLSHRNFRRFDLKFDLSTFRTNSCRPFRTFLRRSFFRTSRGSDCEEGEPVSNEPLSEDQMTRLALKEGVAAWRNGHFIKSLNFLRPQTLPMCNKLARLLILVTFIRA
jgi:hypothetical protein